MKNPKKQYWNFAKEQQVLLVEHNKVNVKLSDWQQNKLKPVSKNQTGVTLRMNIKVLEGKNLPHKLLLTKKN